MDFGELTTRAIRVATLDPTVFREIEEDHDALGQTLVILAVQFMASILGNGRWGMLFLLPIYLPVVVGAWCLWVLLVHLLGGRVLREPETESSFEKLVRTMGFATVPGIFSLFGFLPLVGRLILLVSSLWTLAAVVVAVRETLRYRSTARAAIVVLLPVVLAIGCAAGLLTVILGLAHIGTA